MVLPPEPSSVKAVLTRGAILAAANWPVVFVQFVAEALFKTMLAVPLVGGAVLVVLLVGSDLPPAGTWRTLAFDVAEALVERPWALVWYLVAVLVTVFGGSALLFLLKGGTLTVLVQAETEVGPVERSVPRLSLLRDAAAFRIDRFLEGCRRLFARYLRLGCVLLVIYAGSGAIYLAGLYRWYRAAEPAAFRSPVGPLAWSAGFVGAITLVNFLYLLLQMAIAVEDCSIRAAAGHVGRFLRTEWRPLAALFAVILALVVGASLVFFGLAAGLGLIGFVPLVGIVAFPLQVGAWLARGLVFQWFGLAALSAYLHLYRVSRSGAVGRV